MFVNKTQLIDAVAVKTGDRKQAAVAVDAVFDEITRAVVKGDRVVITGFGSFEKRERPARTGRNPQTGAPVKIKKKSVPAFKSGATLRNYVSGAEKLPKPVKATAAKAVPAKKAAPVKAAAKAAPVKAVKSTAPAKRAR